MGGLVSFHEPIHSEFSPDGRHFVLIEPFTRVLSEYGIVQVPAHFYSDGASIPRFLWAILSPFGPYLEGALVHDWLYAQGVTLGTRAKADRAFRELMDDKDDFYAALELRAGMNPARRFANRAWRAARTAAMYRAVRMFGGAVWRRYEIARTK
jgi:hypothetical protein